ncbi:MAG TPA: PPC domain-containing DNA-binding protein [Chloroflexia bacterium]|nr:PPC domain-containing DNA-binding protein [Chloroflexia bacterium]
MYIVRLESGEAVVETLTGFLEEREVTFAAVSAIGAVEWAELAYWNPRSQTYESRRFDEQMEVVSLQGNCSLKHEETGESKPFLHIHCVLSKQDYSVVAGHLKEARVRPTLEVWLHTAPSPVRRSHDAATGLDLLALRKSASDEAGANHVKEQ